ncbi:MAG: hypothetical protein Q8O24_06280 [Gallionellaceae bacterium]|nr:hypothetical protein [Gallionellaceae bacterium]
MTDIPTMISAFGAAASGLKTTVELVKSLRAGPTHTPPTPELVEMAVESVTAAEKTLLDFKDRAFALQDKNAELEKRIFELEKFHTGNEGLELRVIAPGASAFIDKAVSPPYTSAVWYCAHCLNKGVKSPFNFAQREFHFDTFHCPACLADIKVPNDLRAEVLTTGRGRTDFRSY